MSAPQPPADGQPHGDTAPDDATPSSGSGGSDATYDFHGEKLDFDPYRFGRPEPTAPSWSPTAPPTDPGRPPAPGERWQPGQDAGTPPVRPGDYWDGAGSQRGTFPPAGYVPPAPPTGDAPRVDLGKSDPADRGPYAPPTGYPSTPGQPPYGAPPPYPGQSAPGAYPGAPGTQTTPGNGLAVAGFIVSLAALVLFWTYFIAALIGLVGLGLSIAGLVRARRGAAHRSLASWGIVLGLLAVVIGVALTAYVLSSVDLQCIVDLKGDTSRASECVR